MKRHQWIAGSLALALSVGAGAAARAADDAMTGTATPAAGDAAAKTAADNAPRGNPNRAERQRLNQEKREKRRLELQAMTPEQRQEAQRADREAGLRQMLQRAGADDTASQDAILEYVRAEEVARRAMNENSRKTMQAVTGKAVTESEAGIVLGNLRDAVQDEKARRAAAAKALDLKVGYSKKPRLETLLTLIGAIGDESFYLGGLARGRGQGGDWNGNGNGNGNGGGRNGGAANAVQGNAPADTGAAAQ